MGSRYPQQGSDSRFPRARSPPRFGSDRRPSAPQSGFQARNSDSSYRPSDDLPREPPRGPKGLNEPSRGVQYTPRGRGGYSRGRGGYDSFSRRDSERSWGDRRDTIDDRRPSPIGRGQSRSPPPYRDSRDPPDSARGFDSPTDHRSRGGYFPRGRGGFDRGRGGRPIGSSDRDRFRDRSRSRERDRYDDPRDDRDNFRRDDDRWDRGREASRRDGPPMRPESRVFDEHNRTTSPSTASSASGPYGRPPLSDRPLNESGHPRALTDKTRRSSFPASAQPDARVKDEVRQPQTATYPPSSPPVALSVPAYGSDNAFLGDAASRPSAVATNTKSTNENAKLTATSPVSGPPSVPTGPRAEVSDPLKVAPKGPKADLAKPPPQQGVRRSMSNTMPSARPFETQEQRAPVPNASPKIPSGPRALTGRPTVDTNFNQNASPIFPNAPRSIPTGPKALNMPTLPSSNVWTRPTPRQPPVGPSSAHPAKRDSFGDSLDSQRPRPRSSGDAKQGESLSMKVEPGVQSENGDIREGPGPVMATAGTKSESFPDHVMDVDNDKEYEEAVIPDQIPESDFALPQSDDEDPVSEDGMSEEDLRAQEAKFEREKEQLESRRPLPDREDCELFLMLDELDALAVALDDLKEGRWPPPKKEEAMEPGLSIKTQDSTSLQNSLRLPTPPPAEPSVKFEDLSDEDEEMGNDLQYRRNSPPTPMSQLSMLHDDEEKLSIYDDPARMEQIVQLLALRVKPEKSAPELAKAKFDADFLVWREQAEERDRCLQAEEEANAAADAGAEQPEAPPLPTPSTETIRGRNRGFNTQLDLDQALALSKQTHAEEQARVKEVERDMLTGPDMTKESLITPMLIAEVRNNSEYLDNSNIIETSKVVDLYKLIPPEDNFTPEEQEKFKRAYEKNARKQWGHIAKDIPGRTYKDCIMHYYLTKREHKYKKLLQKKTAGRKGRQGKGKTNALLSDLTGRSDAEGNGKVEVTDTGRPKRAAAPTNFDRRQQQEVETAPQRGRGRGKSAAKPGEGADGMPEKPTRGKAAGKERGKGRGKAAAGSTGPSGVAPGPARRMPVTDGPSEVPTEESRGPSVEDAQLLASFSNSAPIKPMSTHTESWLLPQQGGYTQIAQQPAFPRELAEKTMPMGVSDQQVFNVAADRTVAPMVQPRLERDGEKEKQSVRPSAEGGSTPSKRAPTAGAGKANQSSSYWSVMEQTQVQNWAPYFGKDWDQYSIRMKAKSAVMVRNHVTRLTADGKNPKLATDLIRAEEENRINPNRIDELMRDGTVEQPLGQEQPASLQRPLAPSRRTSGEVKLEREDKPGRPRADSHIPVAPKPASQGGSLEASPASRPRGKSNASIKSSALVPPPQQQGQAIKQQPSQPHNGPHAGFFDAPTKILEKPSGSSHHDDPRQAHTAEPRQAHPAEHRALHSSEHRPVPVGAQASHQESRPSSESRKQTWSITGSYTPHQSTISNYSTFVPQAGAPDEPQQARHSSGQQARYGQHSAYARHEERLPAGVNLHRHDSDPGRNHQGTVGPSAPDDRTARMSLHDGGAPAYQPRAPESHMKPQQPAQSPYYHGREPPRHPMGSLLRDEQSSRPSSSALDAGNPGPRHGMIPGHSSSAAPTPVPQPAAVQPPAPPAAKRSNIMDILNSSDPEPPPKRITTESRAPAPVPTPPPTQQTPVPPPPYQSQYSRGAPVQQQYQPYPEDPYARRGTPDRTGVPSHPAQHPPSQYEAQRQPHDPRQIQAQQHHYGAAPPSHMTHEHGRSWSQNVPQGVPPPQHSYQPEPSRYGAYTAHSSPQPARQSYAPPPAAAPQYQPATQADARYRVPSPAHHSRGASLTGQRPPEHANLPGYPSRSGPPQGIPGVSNPLRQYGAGSPLAQEALRHQDDRERDAQRERQRRESQYPPREYARTPHSYGGPPPPPHYQQQPPPR